MKRWVMVALLAAVTACTGRQVEVRTGPETGTPQAAMSLRVENALTQAVNVYVVSGGLETFVAQVAAQSTQTVAVQGVAAGATVTLRARQVDGGRTYERPNVTLGAGVFDWRVP
jgi:hypothetical protein